MGGTSKEKKGHTRSWFRRIFRRSHSRKYESANSNLFCDAKRTSDNHDDKVQDSKSGYLPNPQSDFSLCVHIAEDHELSESPFPRNATEDGASVEVPTTSVTNFKNELSSKLSSRPPVLFSKPHPSFLSSVQNGDPGAVAENNVPVVSTTPNADPYFGVAMQRINLNRQRGPRTPSRYSTEANTTVFDMTASDISFNGFRDLDRIAEEELTSYQNVSGEKPVTKGFIFDYPPPEKAISRKSVDLASLADKLANGDCSNEATPNKKAFELYSKSRSLENQRKSYPSGSPLRTRTSYHEKSEETLSLTPQTSVSGDGLFEVPTSADDEIVRSSFPRQFSSARPASMLLPACLRDELHGVVQARLPGPPFEEGSQEPSSVGCILSKRIQENPSFQKSGDFSADHSAVVGVRAGLAKDVINRHSYSPIRTSPANVSPRTSSAVMNEAPNPPKVHELIKAFQKASP